MHGLHELKPKVNDSMYNCLTWDYALCRLNLIIRATPIVYEGGYITTCIATWQKVVVACFSAKY